MSSIRNFLAFWYDFIIGDDWTVAVAVAAALAATYGLTRLGVQAWWLTPAVVVLVTGLSTYRAAARSRAAVIPVGVRRQ
jgi:hypothetical protein